MDIQAKFDIAVKLLEHGISMEEIRLCSVTKLSEIAEQKIGVKSEDLTIFAEEVGQRNRHQAAERQRRKSKNAKFTWLLTDDESVQVVDSRQGPPTGMVRPLSNLKDCLDDGQRLEFRIRNKRIAEICGQILGRPIDPTNAPLPPLRSGDLIIIPHDIGRPPERCLGENTEMTVYTWHFTG